MIVKKNYKMARAVCAVIFITLIIFWASGCTTVNTEKQVKNKVGAGLVKPAKPEKKTNGDVALDIVNSEPDIIYIEKPIYIPEGGKAAPIVEGVKSVNESNKSGIMSPSEYSHAARLYDYSGDQVYEVYTQPLRNTDIYMQPGELVLEAPFISDSERWILGAGVNGSGDLMTQHIYIKPKSENLSATLTINTDRRVYHILLRSYKDVYMPLVKWTYKAEAPDTILQLLKFSAGAIGGRSGGNSAAGNITANGTSTGVNNESAGADPRFMSFDYVIRYPLFRKPKWLPKLIFDDGKKTYIVFNSRVLQSELPGVFENEKDIINYRVNGDVIIVDKLIETLTVKYKNNNIQIEKKRS